MPEYFHSISVSIVNALTTIVVLAGIGGSIYTFFEIRRIRLFDKAFMVKSLGLSHDQLQKVVDCELTKTALCVNGWMKQPSGKKSKNSGLSYGELVARMTVGFDKDRKIAQRCGFQVKLSLFDYLPPEE